MKQRVKKCIELLSELIAYRTPNPGGDEVAICTSLEQRLLALGADEATVGKVPRQRDGRAETGAYVLARYGTPRTLINVHVDTVPPNNGWTRDPFAAKVERDRVIGLGSADTKGAAAALLVALEKERPADLGVLFSGDEERGQTCMSHLLEGDALAPVQRAIVCEPTGRTVGIRHRGISGYRAQLQGRGGHSSQADRMPKPVVAMARLAVELDELGRRYLNRGPSDMRGLCMNVARLDGGVAFNVVPDHASLIWSLRPPPGFDEAAFADELLDCVARADKEILLSVQVSNPPFATRNLAGFAPLLGPVAEKTGPLQFWTEAALLAQAGIDAVVVGPGQIEQAHAADEHVSIDDLRWAIELFDHVLRTTREGAS